MPTHLTARLAWHDDGWNGRICKRPDCNTYCTGRHSYPGDVIAETRDLEKELTQADKSVAKLNGVDLPPCIHSINAFGPEQISGYSNPPLFFWGGADRTEWIIPEATVCVWPYEAMYADDVKENGYYNNDLRSAKVDEFFAKIEDNRSLIFYYANYSNPFSEEDSQRYALIGVSRVKEVGDRLVYDNANDDIIKKFAGGLIWARNVTSHYPNQGLRLPYHLYRDDPEKLQRIAVFPENPQTCKYGARHLSNDDAIGLLEQFLSAVYELKAIGDKSEDWDERERWLQGCIADLWSKRGLYPGLLNIMRVLGAEVALEPARALIEKGKSKEAHRLFFEAVDNASDVSQFGLFGNPLQKLSRQWRLKPESAQNLLRDILPRIELEVEHIERIVSEDVNLRCRHGLPDDISAPLENPYLLCERYVGDSADDLIPWGTVDRGVLPSLELGGEKLADMDFDDARRLRALCVEHLRREPNQTFRAADAVLDEVNTRLAKLPDWKMASYNARYFEVDRATLEDALVLRTEGDRLWLYLKDVYEDERAVEQALTKLAGRPDIDLVRPFTTDDWRDQIRVPNSDLLKNAREEYERAVDAQAEACAGIFHKPLAVVMGAAGTGKTSVICAIIRAVRQTEGDGAPLIILAPTGKASDRVRAKMTESGIGRVDTSTIHSFLARGGWLNNNLTFKRMGGKRDGSGTIIVDEASMLDLSLMACLIRAIDWQQVRRLILVGDPNQLPPIGRGRVYADTIHWLSNKRPDSIARLAENLRQLENKVEGKGTAIQSIAELFISDNTRGKDQPTTLDAEEQIMRIHKGGKVDKDLNVIYWDDPATLSETLIQTIESEMADNTGEVPNEEKPYDLWRVAFDDKPEKYQILTPHRGDLHGVEALNEAVQGRIATGLIRKYGMLDGITLFDKVIQYRNRPSSDPISAYNFKTRKPEKIEIFNGEIGFVRKHGLDNKSIRWLKRFQVKFDRKEDFAVNYGSKSEVENNLELAYAISVHKAQGSEFDHSYVLVPRSKGRTLSSELLYTALTRARRHCTLLVQGDVSTLLSARRPENKQINLINSSLFEGRFHNVPDELINRKGWYEEGRVHKALGGEMVRSKSELVIANLLHDRDIPFAYEIPLRAHDGTMYLPDFTVTWQGEEWYWEHWGMMSCDAYKERREKKIAWYNKHFSGRLIETFEEKDLSQKAASLIDEKFS